MTWGYDRLTVLAYHRIAELTVAEASAPGVASATPQEFARQMDYVRQWYTPIDLDRLLEFVTEGRRLPPRPLLITFDDGYRDNYEIALPILEERRLPAVLFVTTGLVGTGRMAWWDRLWHSVRTTRLSQAALPEIGRVRLDGPQMRECVWRLASSALKKRSFRVREPLLEEIEAALGVEGPLRERPDFISWSEAREMASHGFAIQPHTVDHPVLASETPDDARAQIHASIATVAEQTGRPVTAFAFPNGRPSDYRQSEIAALKEADIRLSFTMKHGPVRAQDAWRAPLEIPRVALELKDGDRGFALKIAGGCRVKERAAPITKGLGR
jgi:peptidoglycan/xylan/chitin deacetylase (PgdA/CDA1 family)